MTVSRSCFDGVPVLLWWCPGYVMKVSKEEMVDFSFCPSSYLAIGVSSWANLDADW